MQPIENVDGVTRFKSNKIVEILLDRFGGDLNVFDDAPQEDREQLAQLVGMSVSDYVELPYVSERSSHEAQLAEDELNPSNPYAWELSWVDETEASCELMTIKSGCQFSTAESIVHDKPCWFCFGTGENSHSEFVDGKVDIVGVACDVCKGSKVAPLKQSTP
jgi:hypothetical protein